MLGILQILLYKHYKLTSHQSQKIEIETFIWVKLLI